jgi:pimeloyl-ACP methyl ester carboxylesterase
VTAPIPNWPGQLLTLRNHQQVWVAATPPPGSDRDLVLCVHGMTGAATNWTDLMAELAADFDCLALDLPGSGHSPPPARRSGYSLKALAGTVSSLIETLGAAPVHLIGNSMGGAIAIRVAAARPDLVSTLTLVSPVLPDRRPRRATMHFPVLALPVLGDRLAQRFTRLPPENRIAGVFAACYFDASLVHQERIAAAVTELRRRDALAHDASSLVGAARTLVAETLRPRQLSLWHAAEQVKAPSLVLFGSHDRLVSNALAAPAGRAFRHGRIVVLPETGHLAQMERPALVARLLREMVEEARAAGGAGRSPGIPAAGARLTGNEVTTT